MSDWISKVCRLWKKEKCPFSYQPKISVVVSYDEKSDLLRETLNSVYAQTYRNYEVIQLDVSSNTFPTISEVAGDYITRIDAGDLIEQDSLCEVVKLLNKNPDLDYIYSDEDVLSEDGQEKSNPFYKPDWSPDTAKEIAYANRLAVYREELSNITDYRRIGHVPEVLYHRRESNGRNDWKYSHFEYEPTKDLISIIIPSKDHPMMLKTCIDSVEKTVTDERYEIVVVDNGSSDDNKKKIEAYLKEKNAKYVYEPMGFNFSKMCNLGAKHSSGKYLLFLNDDIEAKETGWLGKMAGHAAQSHTGAVGAKLFYPNSDKIQHAGIINLPVGPVHLLMGQSDAKDYYFGRNRLDYNCMAVTAACLMVSKEKYKSVCGFDESLAIGYNDVDFCFSLYEKGYYNVLRNDVVLDHHESVSRGQDDVTDEKKNRLDEERSYLYKKHPPLKGKDPFYSIRFISDSTTFQPIEHIAYPDIIIPKACKPIPETYGDFILNLDCFFVGEDVTITGWFATEDAKKDNHSEASIIIIKDGNWYDASTKKEYRQDVGDSDASGRYYSGFSAKLDVGLFTEKPDRIGLFLKARKRIAWIDIDNEKLTNEYEQASKRKWETIFFMDDKKTYPIQKEDIRYSVEIASDYRKIVARIEAEQSMTCSYRVLFTCEGKTFITDPLIYDKNRKEYLGEFLIHSLDRAEEYDISVVKIDYQKGMVERIHPTQKTLYVM